MSKVDRQKREACRISVSSVQDAIGVCKREIFVIYITVRIIISGKHYRTKSTRTVNYSYGLSRKQPLGENKNDKADFT